MKINLYKQLKDNDFKNYLVQVEIDGKTYNINKGLNNATNQLILSSKFDLHNIYELGRLLYDHKLCVNVGELGYTISVERGYTGIRIAGGSISTSELAQLEIDNDIHSDLRRLILTSSSALEIYKDLEDLYYKDL